MFNKLPETGLLRLERLSVGALLSMLLLVLGWATVVQAAVDKLPAPRSESAAAAREAEPESIEALTEAVAKEAAAAEIEEQPDSIEALTNAVTKLKPPVTRELNSPFKILDAEVQPGETRRLMWSAGQNFAGMELDTPVLVAHGAKPGPVLCLTAAVHGDELNGIEIVRRVLYSTDPKKMRGTLIGVPIVNLHGFQRSSRYLPDRRDLNRHFPGSERGSSASRIATSFFKSIVRNCHALVDMHTGSFHRTNLTQLRADLSTPAVVALTTGFGATAVLDDKGGKGTLRRAAVDAGIPSVTLEAGEPLRLQIEQVEHGTKAISSLMRELGMLKKGFVWNEPQPVYYESSWVRSGHGGILLATVELGAKVKAGQIIGTITDPITNVQSLMYAPFDGLILGMALNQVVLPGFAAFHIGIERRQEDVVSESEKTTESAASDLALEADDDRDSEESAVFEEESVDHPE